MKTLKRKWINHAKAKLIKTGSIVLIKKEIGCDVVRYEVASWFRPDWIDSEWKNRSGVKIQFMLID